MESGYPERMPSLGANGPALHLLLTDGNTLDPVLPTGLPRTALAQPPQPRGPRRPDEVVLGGVALDPNDLPGQRWGVIAPLDEEGDRLLCAMAPLIRLREKQQGAPAKIYRVPPDMDAACSFEWKNKVYHAVPLRERPSYLLILGDLHQVSIDLQYVLANGAMVGRLCFNAEEVGNGTSQGPYAGYEAYAEKVRSLASGPPTSAAPRALFYSGRDEGDATRLGRDILIKGCIEGWPEDAGAPPDDTLKGQGLNEFLHSAEGASPTVLLSLSHGLGRPAQGWPTPGRQRALQGALSLGCGETLTADVLRGKRFLPAGLWFCFACFGAGTPRTSVFHSWLLELASEAGPAAEDVRKLAKSVAQGLPQPSERPFVAALPQAALASPEGPLAVIGHVDLAWSYGFMDENLTVGRPSRILSVLQALAAGCRAGAALRGLTESYLGINEQLLQMYQDQRDAERDELPDPTDKIRLGNVWMLRNDLRGYVLLGDPAVRLGGVQ